MVLGVREGCKHFIAHIEPSGGTYLPAGQRKKPDAPFGFLQPGAVGNLQDIPAFPHGLLDQTNPFDKECLPGLAVLGLLELSDFLHLGVGLGCDQ